MKLLRLTCLILFFCVGKAFSQQGIRNIHVEIEYYVEEESPVKFLNATAENYQVNLISGIYKELYLQLNIRMEDELNSEETYTILSEVGFLDLKLSYQMGKIGISWGLENLLNYKSPLFAIEGSLENDLGVIDAVSFTHESDFMMSTALSFNF